MSVKKRLFKSKKRCSALDQNGHQCRKRKTAAQHYHGDNELYYWGSNQPGWVKVYMCEEHDTRRDGLDC